MKKKAKKIISIILISLVSILTIVIVALIVYGKWVEKHRSYSEVRVAELKGSATLIRDGEYINLYDSVPLHENDEIILSHGTLVITVDRSMVLCLEDGTDITLKDLGGKEGFSTDIFMYSGAITGRVFPEADHPLFINSSCCCIETKESIFRINDSYDEHDARITVFEGEANAYKSDCGFMRKEKMVVTPKECEIYYSEDDIELREITEINYETIPTQGVSYLQFLSKDTGSERLRDFLAASAEELANTYVHVNRSNGEYDTVISIGNALAVLGDVKTGDYVFFGSYDQGFTAGDEKVEWLVADKKDGKALLVSRYALAADCYDAAMSASGREQLNWQNSHIREWLNTVFYESTFTDEEKAMIICGADGVVDDNVFLLSQSEAMRFFNGKTLNKSYELSDPMNCNAMLVLYPCEQISVPGSSKGSCNWLLRTLSENRKVMSINEFGAIADADPDDQMGIRPAVYVEY